MKPRKKWEPQYRFGGNRASFWAPPVLCESTQPGLIKVRKSKSRKKK